MLDLYSDPDPNLEFAPLSHESGEITGELAGGLGHVEAGFPGYLKEINPCPDPRDLQRCPCWKHDPAEDRYERTSSEITTTGLRVMLALHRLYAGSDRGLVFFENWYAQVGEVMFDKAQGVDGLRGTWDEIDGDRNNVDPISALDALARESREASSKPWGSLAQFTYRPVDPSTIEPRDWLYGRHYIRGAVSGTVAPGGSGKSSLVKVEAVSMAVGRDLLTGCELRSASRVLIWGGEDDFTELQRRVEAIRKLYNISTSELGDRLILISGRDLPLKLARDGRGAFQLAIPLRDRMICALREARVDVAIFDPFVKVHACSENDNNRINAVVDVFSDIAKEANCAVELVHHVRKLGAGEVTADDARGGSAFKDGIRGGLRTINTMTPAQGEKARVKNHKLCFRLDDGKVNMTPPAAKARWFELVSVPLGNARTGKAQDEIGAVRSFVWPEPTDGLADGALLLAQAALGGERYRKSEQSPDWVGHAIGKALGLSTQQKNPERRQVKDLIVQWIKEGHLVGVKEKDKKGMAREFIRFSSSTP